MLKFIIARLRWGSLSKEEKEKLKSLSLRQTLHTFLQNQAVDKHYMWE